MQRCAIRFACAGSVALAALVGAPGAHGQEVRPFVVDPNAVAAPYVPLQARFGYYPLYSPTYNRAYFAAWADAYGQTAAVRPPFQDPRTNYYGGDYAAYYYTSRYYPPKYARYYWYPSVSGMTPPR